MMDILCLLVNEHLDYPLRALEKSVSNLILKDAIHVHRVEPPFLEV